MSNVSQNIFLKSLRGPLSDLLELESEAITSIYMDQSTVQDSFQYRAKRLGLKIASLLLDGEGELNKKMLEQLRHLLSQGSFLCGPGRSSDASIYTHIQTSLKKLSEMPEIWLAIRRFSPPLCHKKAESVIRETLWPEPVRIIQTVHVRKAVIAAWLTLLRQSTGSCFATAPAILVQKNEPLQFFKDLYDLLSIGQLKRVVEGREYTVPLSFSSGNGDLKRVVPGPFFGLAKAIEAAGVPWTREEEKTALEMGAQPVEKIIRELLLKAADLTEEDLRDEEHLTSIQMTPLLAKQGIGYYQRPTERSQKISEWKIEIPGFKSSRNFPVEANQFCHRPNGFCSTRQPYPATQF